MAEGNRFGGYRVKCGKCKAPTIVMAYDVNKFGEVVLASACIVCGYPGFFKLTVPRMLKLMNDSKREAENHDAMEGERPQPGQYL